ncbi:MAG: TatD family hydrolase [Erysipelotrichales bacterium]|nr:TatD family hydrolase [Erysipelotrichales bacterium]
MIDTHAHINSRDLKNIRDEIVRINNMEYLDAIINVGMDKGTNKEVLAIANENSKFYASLGIHPLQSGSVEGIYELSQKEDFSKVVALGETGLDYRDYTESHKKTFIETIELANYLGLPVIIHSNQTNHDCLEIIKEHTPEYGFVFHCFEPDLDSLKEIMKLGGFISVGTPIIRRNACKSLEVIKQVDINSLLIELDYPYMIIDKDTDGINVFKRIQEIRKYKHDELEFILDNNAKRLFRKLDE